MEPQLKAMADALGLSYESRDVDRHQSSFTIELRGPPARYLVEVKGVPLWVTGLGQTVAVTLHPLRGEDATPAQRRIVHYIEAAFHSSPLHRCQTYYLRDDSLPKSKSKL